MLHTLLAAILLFIGLPATGGALLDQDADGVPDVSDPEPLNPTVPRRVAARPGDLLLTKGEGGIVRIDPVTRESGWLAWAPDLYVDSVTATREGQIVASDGGYLVEIDPATGEITRFPDFAGFGQLWTDHDGVLIARFDETVRLGPDLEPRSTYPFPVNAVGEGGRLYHMTFPNASSFAVLSVDLGFGTAYDLARKVYDCGAFGFVGFGCLPGTPANLAADASGRIYVVGSGDGNALRLRVFDPPPDLSEPEDSHSWWRTVDIPVEPVPGFESRFLLGNGPPSSVVVADGTIFVAGRVVSAEESRDAVLAVDPNQRTSQFVYIASTEEPYLNDKRSLAVVPVPRDASCTAGLSRTLPRGTKAWSKRATQCIAKYQRKSSDVSLESCLAEPSRATKNVTNTMLRAEGKLPVCSSSGTDRPATAQATATLGLSEQALREDLFGMREHPGLAIWEVEHDPEIARCQLHVLKRGGRCIHAHHRAFSRCKRERAGAGALLSRDTFEICAATESRVVAKRCHEGARAYENSLASRRCDGVDLAAAFQGLTSETLRAEMATRAACFACLGEARLQGLSGVCSACDAVSPPLPEN